MFIAEILAFNGNALLGTFTRSGFSGSAGNNSNIFLGVQDSIADITSVTYLTFTSNPEFHLQAVAINQVTIGGGSVTATPLPAALPLFATGLGVLGLLGWRRKRRSAPLPPRHSRHIQNGFAAIGITLRPDRHDAWSEPKRRQGIGV